ncbi:hypothetical protein ACRXCV_07675 [Halobacteriovorax sp. GFR7]|uniref:hypothetical protein n=1 Tax=unclassified Halobacteriovorax TaxID=2639665 RepID=UPI003D968237
MKKILPLTIYTLLASCGGQGGAEVASQVIKAPKRVVTEEVSNNYSESLTQTSPFTYNKKTSELFVRRTKIDDITNEKYINISIRRDANETRLNHRDFEKGLRHIKISGIKIVITRDSRIGKLLQNSYDLKSLELNAQEIVIDMTLNLPSTNVAINAKKLKFNYLSKIITTPSFMTDSAPQFGDGLHGATAGTISLNIEEFEYEKNYIGPFVMIGGEGQAAGVGQDGVDGLKVDDLGGGVTYLERGINIPLMRSGPSRIGPSAMGSVYKKQSLSGTKVWPTNGGDAKAGGRPGEGGRGGNLISTIVISEELINNRGGQSGKPAGEYRGGKAGSPSPAYQRYYVHNKLHKNTRKDFIAGKDVKSPVAINELGEAGETLSMEYKTWLTGEFLEQSLKYGNDLFIGNHFKKAYSHFSNLEDLCQNSSELDSLATLKCLKVRTQFQKLSSNLNFFGEKINQLPLFSLEANSKLYRKDIESSLKLIFLSKMNSLNKFKLEDKLNLMGATQDELYTKASNDNFSLSLLNRDISKANKVVAELNHYEDEFKAELANVEAQIRNQAKRNIIAKEKKAKLFKVLSSIASVGSVIPIGQPAIGIATQSLASFMQVSHDGDFKDTLKGFRKLYKSVKEIDMDESSKNWNEGFSKIKYSTLRSDLEEAKNTKERDEIYDRYLNDVEEVVSPIVKSLTKEINSYKRISFPRNAVEKEIARLKNSDDMFKTLTTKLSALVSKRKEAVDALSTVQTSILSTVLGIQDSFDQIARISYAKQNLLLNEKYILTTDFDSIIDNAVNRLLSYNYDLYNSIQYTYLGEANEYSFYESLDQILNRMDIDLRLRDENDLDNDISNYITMFEDNFRHVAYRIVERLEKNNLKYEKDFILHLNKEEIDRLNNGNDIYIDMFKYQDILNNEEGLKVKNIKVVADYDASVYRSGINMIEVLVTHGESHFIRSNENLFELTSSVEHKWGTSIDIISGRQTEIAPSKVNFSSFGAIADIDVKGLDVFNRASLLGQYKVEFINKTEEDVKLTNLSLVVEYEYQ